MFENAKISFRYEDFDLAVYLFVFKNAKVSFQYEDFNLTVYLLVFKSKFSF